MKLLITYQLMIFNNGFDAEMIKQLLLIVF